MLTEPTSTHIEHDIPRRSFVAGAIYLLTSLIATTLTASIGRYLFSRPRTQDAETWSDAGEIPELRSGVPRQITFVRRRTDAWDSRNEKTTAWVILNNQQSLTAFAPSCPHLGCAYHWDTENRLFVCPCHGSLFNRAGNVIAGPAVRPLDRYEVKIEGARLWLGPVQQGREH